MGISDNLAFRIARRLFDRLDWKAQDALVQHAHREYEELTYRRLSEIGMRASTIVDIGAYHGSWSRMMRTVLPAARIHMVEAQPALAPKIERAAREIGNALAHSALLSSEEGQEVAFHVMGTGSSMRRENSSVEAETLILRTTTLDRLLGSGLDGPLFLKLDAQGAELDILRGGLETLKRSDYVQIEVAFQNYNDGAPLVAEVMAFMRENAFLATEIVGFSRPADHLVQADFLFARAGDVLRPDRFDLG